MINLQFIVHFCSRTPFYSLTSDPDPEAVARSPPSTKMFDPVTKLAPGEAANKMAALVSGVEPILRTGYAFAMISTISGVNPAPSNIGVCIAAGLQ